MNYRETKSMPRLKRKAVFLITLPLLSTIVYSQTEPHSEHQSYSLGAHEHGKAELTIAIEDTFVEIQFISPAANIYGFEHAPRNLEQEQKIFRAEEVLSEADRLFEFEGVICQLVDQALDLPFLNELSEVEHKHEQHSEDGHEHGHNHDEHKDQHVEVVASYRFECNNSDLTGLSVLILDQFPAIESLEALWVTSTTQGAMELTIYQPKIDLR